MEVKLIFSHISVMLFNSQEIFQSPAKITLTKITLARSKFIPKEIVDLESEEKNRHLMVEGGKHVPHALHVMEIIVLISIFCKQDSSLLS